MVVLTSRQYFALNQKPKALQIGAFDMVIATHSKSINTILSTHIQKHVAKVSGLKIEFSLMIGNNRNNSFI